MLFYPKVAAALLDKHLDMNGLFLIRRSGRSATEYVLEICYKQQIKHYIISEFVSLHNFFVFIVASCHSSILIFNGIFFCTVLQPFMCNLITFDAFCHFM
jgi:hypothetical protein